MFETIEITNTNQIQERGELFTFSEGDFKLEEALSTFNSNKAYFINHQYRNKNVKQYFIPVNQANQS